MKSRLPKESRRNATVSPYDRPTTDAHHLPVSTFHSPKDEQEQQSSTSCDGELQQITSKGMQVHIHLNASSASSYSEKLMTVSCENLLKQLNMPEWLSETNQMLF